MQTDTKTVLQTTDISAHLKAAPKPLTDIELQQDYDYFMAQEATNTATESRMAKQLLMKLLPHRFRHYTRII